MEIRIRIETGNDAFHTGEPDALASEVERILEQVTGRVRIMGLVEESRPLVDLNGNTVGAFEVIDPDKVDNLHKCGGIETCGLCS